MPTYNRSETLDFFLTVHVPILKKHNVPLYISDNASTDNTLAVIEKWQKEFSGIFCVSKTQTTPPDENVESALKLSSAEYTWLMGDSYEIPEKTLEKVLYALPAEDEFYNVIITNHVNKITDLPERVYTDHNNTLRDIGWLVTCLAVKIYHRTVLEQGKYGKYFGTDFAHVGFALDYIATNPFRLYWLQSASVVTLKTPQRKGGWGIYFFINIFKNWPALVDKLPATFSPESKAEFLKAFPEKSGLLGWRNLLLLRSQGLLTPKILEEYADNIDSVAPSYFRNYVKFLFCLPVPISKIVIKTIEWYRRKRFQLLKFIKPKAAI